MLRTIVLLCVLCASVVNAQDRTAWMREARFGVMTHYLADWIARSSGEPQSLMSVERWNAQVDAFDVEGLASQLHSAGTGYYLISFG